MSTARQYELVYIITPEATEQEIADLHTQIEQIVQRFNGTLDKTENWGRKRLAYDIGHHREGTYVVETITGSGELMKEIDRRLRVIDQVIRHLVVRVDEELRVARADRATRARSSWRGAASRAACRPSGSRVKDAATAMLRTTWKAWRSSDEGRTRRRRPRRSRRRQEGRQGRRRFAAPWILPPPPGMQVLRGKDRLHQLQGRAAAGAVSARSAERFSRGGFPAPARCISASCRSRSSARASWR